MVLIEEIYYWSWDSLKRQPVKALSIKGLHMKVLVKMHFFKRVICYRSKTKTAHSWRRCSDVMYLCDSYFCTQFLYLCEDNSMRSSMA